MSFTSSERRGLLALAAVMTVLIAVTAWLAGRNQTPASLPPTAVDTTAAAVIDTTAADTVTMPTRKRRGIKRKNTTRKRAATPTVRRILNDTVKS
ncbi:MAG: hypothetical protein OSJ46_10850 [Duncaniella sp.]|nr:hypothetical protein [Duncaniella sp.]HBI58683.1 hypothetical protein [Porphyromonadaceae bacterium]